MIDFIAELIAMIWVADAVMSVLIFGLMLVVFLGFVVYWTGLGVIGLFTKGGGQQ